MTRALSAPPAIPALPRVPIRKRLATIWHFLRGYLAFPFTRRTSFASCLALAHLACNTDGRLNDGLALISRVRRPKRTVEPHGVLGSLGQTTMRRIVNDLRAHGYHVFDTRLSIETCQRIIEFAERAPCLLKGDGITVERARSETRFDRENPEAPIYRIARAEDMCAEPQIQRLLADRSLLAIAQSYIGSQPVLDSINMWWSVPFGHGPDDRGAQLYHVDMPHIRFLKFFFYLVDVGPDNGPHCYVRGSNGPKPRALRRYRRYRDGEIQHHYPASELVELDGAQGAIIAVDTSGFHKGKPVTAGERLLLQIEFANSLFGAPFETVTLDDQLDGEFERTVREFPYAFQLFRLRKGRQVMQ